MADTKKPRQPSTPPRTAPIPAAPTQKWEAGAGDLGRTISLGRTVRMDAVHAALKPPPLAAVPPSAPAREAPAPYAGPGVELVVVDEAHVPGGERRAWRAAEVWTKRRVYGLDSTFRCVEIIDRETGRPEIRHDLLGARLGGGRLRERETVRFSYPLPLPGMEAMFTKGKKHGYTSAVERMILRIRLLHTSAEDAAPSWDEIASRWSDMPPAR